MYSKLQATAFEELVMGKIKHIPEMENQIINIDHSTVIFYDNMAEDIISV